MLSSSPFKFAGKRTGNVSPPFRQRPDRQRTAILLLLVSNPTRRHRHLRTALPVLLQTETSRNEDTILRTPPSDFRHGRTCPYWRWTCAAWLPRGPVTRQCSTRSRDIPSNSSLSGDWSSSSQGALTVLLQTETSRNEDTILRYNLALYIVMHCNCRYDRMYWT
jgi:hypothetical protein